MRCVACSNVGTGRWIGPRRECLRGCSPRLHRRSTRRITCDADADLARVRLKADTTYAYFLERVADEREHATEIEHEEPRRHRYRARDLEAARRIRVGRQLQHPFALRCLENGDI